VAVDMGKSLSVGIADFKATGNPLDSPGRREASFGHPERLSRRPKPTPARLDNEVTNSLVMVVLPSRHWPTALRYRAKFLTVACRSVVLPARCFTSTVSFERHPAGVAIDLADEVLGAQCRGAAASQLSQHGRGSFRRRRGGNSRAQMLDPNVCFQSRSGLRRSVVKSTLA
jgi:hypothetical protein